MMIATKSCMIGAVRNATPMVEVGAVAGASCSPVILDTCILLVS